MKQPSRWAPLRWWIADHKLPLGMVLALPIIAMVFVIMAPISSGEAHVGTVEGFGLTEGDHGSYPMARVRMDGRQFVVALPRAHDCRVGSPIRLHRVNHLWWSNYQPDWNACGAAPPAALNR